MIFRSNIFPFCEIQFLNKIELWDTSYDHLWAGAQVDRKWAGNGLEVDQKWIGSEMPEIYKRRELVPYDFFENLYGCILA